MNRREFIKNAVVGLLVSLLPWHKRLYPLYHTFDLKAMMAGDEFGCCGGVAFYSTVKWQEGDICQAWEVRKVDGTMPKSGETVACGACKRELHITDVSYEPMVLGKYDR